MTQFINEVPFSNKHVHTFNLDVNRPKMLIDTFGINTPKSQALTKKFVLFTSMKAI